MNKKNIFDDDLNSIFSTYEKIGGKDDNILNIAGKNKSHITDDHNSLFSSYSDKNGKVTDTITGSNKTKTTDPFSYSTNANSYLGSSEFNLFENKQSSRTKKNNSYDKFNNPEDEFGVYGNSHGNDNGFWFNNTSNNSRIPNRPTNGMDKREVNNGLDIYDWNNPDNCSEREWLDDDDYDDFDND